MQFSAVVVSPAVCHVSIASVPWHQRGKAVRHSTLYEVQCSAEQLIAVQFCAKQCSPVQCSAVQYSGTAHLWCDTLDGCPPTEWGGLWGSSRDILLVEIYYCLWVHYCWRYFWRVKYISPTMSHFLGPLCQNKKKYLNLLYPILSNLLFQVGINLLN